MNPGVPLDRPVTQCLSHAAVTLRENLTIDQALAALRSGQLGVPAPGQTSTPSQVLYFYVVNATDQLVGVLPARQLILSPGTALVGDVMTREIVTLRQKETLFDAMELFAMYRLLARSEE